MNSLLLDVISALRFFSRRKAAFVAIVFTLAFALAANVTAFAVLHSFLFGSLAIPEADRVVVVSSTKTLPGRGLLDFQDAFPNYRLLNTATHSFERLAATFQADVSWEEANEARHLQGFRVTSSFFEVMRVKPILGREIGVSEEGPHAAPVAIISHRLWRNAFNGASEIVGRTIRLNGSPHTVIGIMPPGFEQPSGTDVWLPFDLPQAMWSSTVGARQISVFGRLRDGTTLATANQDLHSFATKAVEADPANKNWGWRARSLREVILDGSDKVVLFVQGGAIVLLLLAICNLGSLLLAWSADRQRDTTVRLALGASSWRIFRQSIVQNVILIGFAGLVGLAAACLTLPWLRHVNPTPALAGLLDHVTVDTATVGFALIVTLCTAVLAGLSLTWQTRRISLIDILHSESRGATSSPRAIRWQQGLVTFQAAISVIILISAALAAIGLEKLNRVQLGFGADRRAVFRLELPEPAYDTNEKRAQFVRTLEEKLSQEPAIEAYGVTTTLPVGDTPWGGSFLPQLDTGEFIEEPVIFHFRRVSPGYLAAMGIPLLEGRGITPDDRQGSPLVALVSKALADHFWPGTSAIGRKVRRSVPDSPLIEIVGVVGNVRDAGPAEAAGEAIYVPFDQVPFRLASVVLRARKATGDAIVAGRRALQKTSPDVAAYDVAPLTLRASQAVALPRLQMVMLLAFALIAVAITALGTYGVMSQVVAIRQKELAIRAALGATPQGILRYVMLNNARLGAFGISIGTIAAWAASRWLGSKLTSFDASALWPFAAVSLVVLFLTQVASFIPAQRGARANVQSLLTQV